MELCTRWPFTKGTIKYMDVVEPYHPSGFSRQLWPRAIYTRSSVPSIGSTPRPICEQIFGQVWVPTQDNWERWRNHLLAPEVRGDKAEFEFLATPDYLPWFLKVSHPVITNPSHEDEDMVATTIADNELLERNRRALDATLRWMDLPPELCTIESARTMASDIVNFLSGRSIGPTTTSTTPATATAQPPHPPLTAARGAPKMVALLHTPPRQCSARHLPMLALRRECLGRSIEGRI
ncbi:hypothetical protein Scep_029686 [Stephania cephalantha]|uniref:Uncharacterized protein n=1 Tax=Stephania cephalantha TaxID=152367 RepID=A0AAP0DY71_9MAGN